MQKTNALFAVLAAVLLVLGCADAVQESCPAGLTQCGGQCVDTRLDATNCSGCGVLCPDGMNCTLALCTSCPSGALECNGVCIDVLNDVQNCGGCGSACQAGESCVQGVCAIGGGQPPPGMTPVPTPVACVGDNCMTTPTPAPTAGTPTPAPATPTPDPACGGGIGQLMCGGICTDTQTSRAHCGRCDNDCGSQQSCTGGQCGCAGGQLACGLLCVNQWTDINNCGSCGNACGAGQACSNGECVCQGGGVSCNGTCVNTNADVNHCGGCNQQCTTGVCSNGSCTDSCAAGLENCNGSCVDRNSDAAHCGVCDNACQAGQSCNGGQCTCADPNQEMCGGVCTDVRENTTHCGSCGNFCLTGQVCSNGTCVCPGGQEECDGSCVAAGSCNAGPTPTPTPTPTPGETPGDTPTPTPGETPGDTPTPTPNPGMCSADAEAIADFETGTTALVSTYSGWAYTFVDSEQGSVMPVSATDGPSPLGSPYLPSGDATMMCSEYAFHSSATGNPRWAGFGVTFEPREPFGSNNKAPINASAHSGFSFRIRSGSGTAPAVFAEVQTRENQPAPAGVATNDAVDTYNTRGKLISNIGTSWQTVHVPFGTMAPRYLPDAACAAGVLCEAPAFVPASMLGIQFGVYDQFNQQRAYELWIDDVRFYSGDQGLPTLQQTQGANHPFPQNRNLQNGCVKPANADGKFLVDMYQLWKSTFVRDAGSGRQRVIRPENDNDSVSEGIAYGMLIAVYMNDKPLFDGLWSYWSNYSAGSGPLMHWRINSGGNVQETGSATDADLDAAFALLQAAKQWGGSYQQTAVSVIQGIRSACVEGSGASAVLKPGNSFGGASLTNPSYFSPAYYRLFAQADSAGASTWNGLVDQTYTYLTRVQGQSGLVPAWCSNSCNNAGGGGYEDNNMYQYDSHRTPWRIGLDACWNNEARARSYVTLTSNFFSGRAANGVGTLYDVYSMGGQEKSGSAKNSMSIVGTAAAGAMVTAGNNNGHRQFLDRSYRFILDASYTPDPDARRTAYTYYNATVGLLMALTLTGNFVDL